MNPHIVLCGCTGPVGRMLVARLAQSARLSLVGRNPVEIATLFPGSDALSYRDFAKVAGAADLVVNLAARNNDREGSPEDFLTVNRDFALALAEQTRAAGTARFVNLSTFHAIEEGSGPYGQSKAAAERAFAARPDLDALTLRIPAVHGELASGRLASLKRLPRPLRRPAFVMLSAFRPVLSADRLASFLRDEAREWPDAVTELADDLSGNRLFGIAKRMIDVVFALAVTLLLWWLLALVWVAVRAESPGPGIFRQTRVGRGGRPFVCYKFRTMAAGTHHSGTHEVQATAITRVGKWLRRTKIDELPQVVNLLRKEVSLVGPRPCLPMQEELIAERRRRGVLEIAPGITGLAQVNNIDMSAPKLLAQWDRRYTMTRSLPAELKLIVATFMGRGQGDRVRSLSADPA